MLVRRRGKGQEEMRAERRASRTGEANGSTGVSRARSGTTSCRLKGDRNLVLAAARRFTRRRPLARCEALAVPRQDRGPLRPVDDRPGAAVVPHLRQRERGAAEVFRPPRPSRFAAPIRAKPLVRPPQRRNFSTTRPMTGR